MRFSVRELPSLVRSGWLWLRAVGEVSVWVLGDAEEMV